MSQSKGKGSLGANSKGRLRKAHIPFRGDDLEHGKKTGKTISRVSRDADGFEPFEQVLEQAYRDNGPRAVSNRSEAVNGRHPRRPSPIPDDYDDSGELSMDIDSAPNSPSAYFNTVAAPQPSSAKRAGSSSRPLARRSSVDYDRVPSPRRSSTQSHARSHPHNPSGLRLEIQDDDDETARAVNAHADDDPFSQAADYEGQELEYPGAGDDGTPFNSHGSISFTELARHDEEDSVAEDDLSHILTRAEKAKGRAEVQESDEEDNGGLEDDIATGLQEVEEEAQYDDEEERNSGPSDKKHRPHDDKSRSPSADPEPPKKPPKKPRPKRTKARISMHETLDEDGLRRSKRRHYPPLEYWRQEKVVWGRRETGRSVVPVIKEIITIPKPPPEPLGGKKRKRGTTRPPRSKSKSAVSPSEEIRVVEVDNPEQGWDDETEMHGVVLDWNTGTDVERRVAFTSKMLNPKVAANSNYLFQKVFGDNDFIAAGQILIPPGEQKPAKPAKDNTYVFYLIEGAVQFKVHRSSFVVATGGMFLVPRGNQYYIENICQRDAKLFFAQARKIPERDSDVAPNVRAMISGPPRASTAPRSPSRSVPSPKQVSASKGVSQVPPEKT